MSSKNVSTKTVRVRLSCWKHYLFSSLCSKDRKMQYFRNGNTHSITLLFDGKMSFFLRPQWEKGLNRYFTQIVTTDVISIFKNLPKRGTVRPFCLFVSFSKIPEIDFPTVFMTLVKCLLKGVLLMMNYEYRLSCQFEVEPIRQQFFGSFSHVKVDRELCHNYCPEAG